MDKPVSSFSIFLPVRNGGKYLPLCVESILVQSYQHFNLVILENDSSDGTFEWLQALERKDSKVKVLPSGEALSIEDNWQRILAEPKNEFMTIIGHDDLLDPDYLQVMSSLIAKYPDASLYHAHFRMINENGEVLRKCLPMPSHQTDTEFLNEMLNLRIDSFGTGYVMRSAHYEKVGGIPKLFNLMFADHVLWVTLLQGSWKATAQRECVAYRLHADSTSALTSGMDYLEGLGQFVGFLGEKSESDHGISLICRDSLPKYVFVIHRDVYFTYLYIASLKNTILGNNVKDLILLSLERLQPKLVHKFNTSTVIHIVEMLNRSSWRKIFSTVWDQYKSFRNFIIRGFNS